MFNLNFPDYKFKIFNQSDGNYIYDIIRKKPVKLTPEEFVRQHLIHYLVFDNDVPTGLIGVEKSLKIGNVQKRFDLVIFNRKSQALLLAECKAPNIEITDAAFDQAARYNINLQADYFIITNGLTHFFCQIDHSFKKYNFIDQFPVLVY